MAPYTVALSTRFRYVRNRLEAPTCCAFFDVLLSYIESALESCKIPLPLDFGQTFDPSSRMLAAAEEGKHPLPYLPFFAISLIWISTNIR
jgi:hypothetical protein